MTDLQQKLLEEYIKSVNEHNKNVLDVLKELLSEISHLRNDVKIIKDRPY